MSLHVFGAIVTSNGCAANNRGETEGNITTLQKLLWKDEVHTTVSSEAVRWALRYYWQIKGIEVNRNWDDDKNDHTWKDPSWEGWNLSSQKTYIDDDVLGYMHAEGAKAEVSAEGQETTDTEEATSPKGKPKGRTKKPKGSASVRRGVLEIARAISTTPYAGDISFNSCSGAKGRTSLYGTEMHCTRYQYGFSMTPERLHEKKRCLSVINALVGLGEVAGNHSRFLFDFSPESIVLRITQDPAPRILYCFEEENGQVTVSELIQKIESGDILAEELYIGGAIAQLPKLQALNPKICVPGVKKAAEECMKVLEERLSLKQER